MTEAEILGLTRRAGGINRQHDEQAAQPDITSRRYDHLDHAFAKA